MIFTGLTSVTFRKLSPEEIVRLCAQAGLDGIEWGGDIHVPHGDKATAEKVLKLTKDAGLKVSSYGSYYFAGHEGEKGLTFDMALRSAAALRAPVIRVWAGHGGSAETDAERRKYVTEDAARIARMCEKEGIKLFFEYHLNTLTDTPESAKQLMLDLKDVTAGLYWQPEVKKDAADNLSSLGMVSPWIGNIHVFHWNSEGRQLLSEGKSEWAQYLEDISKLEADRYCLLEFVRDESKEAFTEDAAVLRKLVSEANSAV